VSGERVAWKYQFESGAETLEVEVPVGSRAILFALQGQTFGVWMEHPIELEHLPKELRTFLIRGTGDPTPEGSWEHRGSTVVQEGRFVFHLYERRYE
jgi:hypothetical protein